MITDTFGIFSGGAVTLDGASNKVRVAPAIIRTSSQENVGFGAPGRQITVHFGAAQFNFVTTAPSELEAPLYDLYIDNLAGNAYVVYDHGVHRDVVITKTPGVNHVILARLTWPAGTTAMAQVSVDTASRQESRIITANDPINAVDLYDAGMDFSDVSFNAPLISMSVLANVLQGELRSRSGDNFAVVLLRRSDIVGVGVNLSINPFRVVMREPVGAAASYKLIDTKEIANFVIDVNVKQRLFIWLDPATGVVGAGFTQTPNTILCAYGDIEPADTGLQDVLFTVATEISQANAQSGSQVAVYRDALPSGFTKPSDPSPLEGQPKLLVPASVAIVNGVHVNVNEEIVDLPEAPDTGDRLDLAYLEVFQNIEGAAPSDGASYVPLLGVGYIVARYRIAIAEGVEFDYPEAMMTAGAPVLSLGNSNFVRDPRGFFQGVNPTAESYDGVSYAVPLALMHRFNKGAWTVTNLNGGGRVGGVAGADPTRPDGKVQDAVHPDEFLSLAPVAPMKGTNYQAVLHAALQAVLSGNHPGALGKASQGTWYSRRPLQLDAIKAGTLGDARMVGVPDGVRQEWSATPRVYTVGATFTENVGRTGAPPVTYEEGAKTVVLAAPAGAVLVTEAGQPAARLFWVETGEEVALNAPGWSVGPDPANASATLDVGDANYQAAGLISVTFEVQQGHADHLAHVVEDVVYAKVNGAAIAHARLGAVRFVTADNGDTYRYSPADAPMNGDAVVVEIGLVADGDDTVTVPLVFDGREVVGVVEAWVMQGEDFVPADIETLFLGATEHQLRLAAAVPDGTAVRVAIALGGRKVTVDPRHLGIVSVDESLLFQAAALQGVAGKSDFTVALRHGSPPLSARPHVLAGTTGTRFGAAGDLKAGVYIDGRLYPATIEGIGENLMTVRLALTDDEFAPYAAEADVLNRWEQDVDDLWKLKGGQAYTLQVPLLWSDALRAEETFELGYTYKPLPFLPAVDGQVYQVAHHGKVLTGNSSVANDWGHRYAPLAEKLPLVRGKRIAVGLAQPSLFMADALEVGGDGELPWDGTAFGFDGEIKFHAGVFDPDSGYAVWAALVSVNRYLRLFVYVIEGDTLTVADYRRAFLSYPLQQFVE